MQCECTTSVEYSDNIFSILVSPLLYKNFRILIAVFINSVPYLFKVKNLKSTILTILALFKVCESFVL